MQSGIWEFTYSFQSLYPVIKGYSSNLIRFLYLKMSRKKICKVLRNGGYSVEQVCPFLSTTNKCSTDSCSTVCICTVEQRSELKTLHAL